MVIQVLELQNSFVKFSLKSGKLKRAPNKIGALAFRYEKRYNIGVKRKFSEKQK